MASKRRVRAKLASRPTPASPTSTTPTTTTPTTTAPARRMFAVDSARLDDAPRLNVFEKMARATKAVATGQLSRYTGSRGEPKIEVCEVDGHVWCDNGRGTRCLRCDVMPNGR